MERRPRRAEPLLVTDEGAGLEALLLLGEQRGDALTQLLPLPPTRLAARRRLGRHATLELRRQLLHAELHTQRRGLSARHGILAGGGAEGEWSERLCGTTSGSQRQSVTAVSDNRRKGEQRTDNEQTGQVRTRRGRAAAAAKGDWVTSGAAVLVCGRRAATCNRRSRSSSARLLPKSTHVPAATFTLSACPTNIAQR